MMPPVVAPPYPRSWIHVPRPNTKAYFVNPSSA